MTRTLEKDGTARGQELRVPDFFIVGQPKAGTTALYSMLRAHPQIFMPETKEVGFFAPELAVGRPSRPDGRGNPTTLEGYAQLFEPARPDQRAGEGTPFYLWSRTAAGSIARVAPHARIIAILREPASLLRSLHLLLVRIYAETETDFRAALALEEARSAGRELPRHGIWPDLLRYSEQVRYVEQLRRYEASFGREQMLILIYDDFRAENAATLQRVLRFLEVDSSWPLPVGGGNPNPTVRVRSSGLHELVHAVSVGHGPLSRAAKATIKALTPARLRREALHTVQRRVVFGDPEPPDERFMNELRRRFEGEVVALSEHLGRDLVTLWGYDSLG